MNTSQERPAGARCWVLAIDGSASANRCARYVAQWAGALAVDEIHVVNSQPIESFRAYALHRDRMMQQAAEAASEATARARTVLDAAHVRYRSHVGYAEPAQCILDVAAAQHAEEIVLGTRGLGPVSSLVLGSVAYKVIHLAEAAVTIVPAAMVEDEDAASSPSEPHRVLLAVDGSSACRHAVDYVRDVAAGARVEVDVHIAHVRTPATAEAEATPSDDTLDVPERDVGLSVLRVAEEALAAAGVRYRSHLVSGPLAESLVDLSIAHRCARIVMGSRGLGALENLVLGSVAYQVLHRATIPVTIVK